MTETPHTVTRQQFHDDPGAVCRLAERVGTVTIVREDGTPSAIISCPRDRRPTPEIEPDECDNCHAKMDGDIASTSDVCFDCWRAVKSERDVAVDRVRVLETQATASARSFAEQGADLQRALDRVHLLQSSIDAALEDGNSDKPDHVARLRMLDRLRRAITPRPEPEFSCMECGEEIDPARPCRCVREPAETT